jgi:magnesium-transporting ATPase (P-type)
MMTEPGAAAEIQGAGDGPARRRSGALLAVGLTSAQVERRHAADGPNALPEARRPSVVIELGHQLTHLLAVLLWVASALALVAGQPALAAAIAIVVVLNAVFAFAQEHHADRSAARLRSLLPMRARVRRDNRVAIVDAADLVVGDVVLLEPGDRVPADLVLTSSVGLALDESLVTGESAAAHRSTGAVALAGTFVVEGEAEAVVQAIGGATAIAQIAAMTREARRPPSPLTQQLNRVVRVVAVVAVLVGVVLGAAALWLGLRPVQAFLFAVGVSVALVPEGLLPTVTLSLARGASRMAGQHALVRRLDAVETLGATTYICTDKTGTLTQSRMAVVEVWTPAGTGFVDGVGYDPEGVVRATPEVAALMRAAAESAVRCVSGRVSQQGGEWRPVGDPMEAALHALALRLDAELEPGETQLRRPYSADRMLSSVVLDGVSHVLGAPEVVLGRCSTSSGAAALDDLARRGRRVIAVARGTWQVGRASEEAEHDLDLVALVGLQDPPRPDVAEAVAAARAAGIRVAMVTGDHPGTAEAIAREVGLLDAGGRVLDGEKLPVSDSELAELLDVPLGVVVARVSPAGKLRIARVLRGRGHVVAMTGDGVNDAPALREADVGVAMGRNGSDVARQAADLVLLDDHFGTIVRAVELGRSTFANTRRFLTYHLTDNVAELAPFVAWALTGGQLPLAIGVLQVLALDIGTDMLPALALGAESPERSAWQRRSVRLVDGRLMLRAFGVLGVTEAALALGAFVVVLRSQGWSWGAQPSALTLATASGAAFATIAVTQMANAFGCRSEIVPAWRVPLGRNRLLVAAVGAELALLVLFVGFPPLSRLLGGAWPPPSGWLMAVAGALVLLAVDALHKTLRRGRQSALVARAAHGPSS